VEAGGSKTTVTGSDMDTATIIASSGAQSTSAATNVTLSSARQWLPSLNAAVLHTRTCRVQEEDHLFLGCCCRPERVEQVQFRDHLVHHGVVVEPGPRLGCEHPLAHEDDAHAEKKEAADDLDAANHENAALGLDVRLALCGAEPRQRELLFAAGELALPVGEHLQVARHAR
jgi:hypothetical protein